ncbi:MAG: hypothetical protein ACLGIB_09255 [Actinomycetota bacterium]
MKLTGSTALTALGIALAIGLFIWAWTAMTPNHWNRLDRGYGVSHMFETQDGAAPMPGMTMTGAPMTGPMPGSHGTWHAAHHGTGR